MTNRIFGHHRLAGHGVRAGGHRYLGRDAEPASNLSAQWDQYTLLPGMRQA